MPRKPSGTRMVQAGIRVPPETLARLREKARSERRTVSNVGMLAVHMYLAGGADKYAELMAAQAKPEPPLVPVEVQLYGEKIRRLPEQLQVKVMEYAEALELLYATKRAANGEVALSVGTVLNTWVAPSSSGKSGKRRSPPRARSPREGESK